MNTEEIKASVFHHWRDAVWTSGRKALRAAEDSTGLVLLMLLMGCAVLGLLMAFFLGFVLGRFSAPIEVRLGQLWQQSEIERQAVALGEREDLGKKSAVLHKVGEFVALPGEAVDFKDATKSPAERLGVRPVVFREDRLEHRLVFAADVSGLNEQSGSLQEVHRVRERDSLWVCALAHPENDIPDRIHFLREWAASEDAHPVQLVGIFVHSGPETAGRQE